MTTFNISYTRPCPHCGTGHITSTTELVADAAWSTGTVRRHFELNNPGAQVSDCEPAIELADVFPFWVDQLARSWCEPALTAGIDATTVDWDQVENQFLSAVLSRLTSDERALITSPGQMVEMVADTALWIARRRTADPIQKTLFGSIERAQQKADLLAAIQASRVEVAA
jgi:hypothetical protein